MRGKPTHEYDSGDFSYILNGVGHHREDGPSFVYIQEGIVWVEFDYMGSNLAKYKLTKEKAIALGLIKEAK